MHSCSHNYVVSYNIVYEIKLEQNMNVKCRRREKSIGKNLEVTMLYCFYYLVFNRVSSSTSWTFCSNLINDYLHGYNNG